MLKKGQEILIMLQEQFSKFINWKTKISDISTAKPSTNSLVFQIESDQAFANCFEKCGDILWNNFADILGDIIIKPLLLGLETAKTERVNSAIHPFRT